jgi:Fur family transcriptional regulator, ferric uptake regulator
MSRNGDDVMTIADRRLRRVNQRLTGGRRLLLAVLAGSDRPLTLPEILEANADLAQSSAYRNLVVLETAEVVQRVVTGNDFTRYELTEELTGHHHHLVCDTCGRVEDLAAGAALERAVSAAVEDARRQHGFQVEHHRLDLVGRCVDCA